MVHFILAGVADDELFEQAEQLGHFCGRNLPDFQVTILTVPKDEWETFENETFQKHRWDIRLSEERKPFKVGQLQQFAWRSSGMLIGDASAFILMIKANYGISI